MQWVREMKADENYLRPVEAARLLQVSLRTFWYWVARGEIPADCLMRFGATLRVNRQRVLEAGIRNAGEYLKKMRRELSDAEGDQV